jgi:hypothetical protein
MRAELPAIEEDHVKEELEMTPLEDLSNSM